MIKVASIRTGIPISATQQTITIPNIGSPKAAMFIMNRCPSGSTITPSVAFNIGFTNGSGSNQLVYAINCEDNVGTSDTHRMSSDDLCMIMLNPTDGTEDCRAAFVEWVEDGVTIEWLTAPSDDFTLTTVLFAGDVSELNTYIGTFTTPDVLNSGIVVSGIGFEPDQVIGIGGGGTFGFDLTTRGNACLSFGFCDNDNGTVKQGSVNYCNLDNLADTSVRALVSQTYFARDFAGDFGAVELGDFNSSGFTATTRISGAGMIMGFLALKYNGNVKHDLGFISTPTFATGIQTISGIGFGPQFIAELQTMCGTYDTQITDFNAGSIGIATFGSGMVTPSSFQMNHNLRSQTGAATSNEDSRTFGNTTFLRRSDEALTVGITSTLQSVYYDGYSKNFSSNVGNKRWINLLISNPISSSGINFYINGIGTETDNLNLSIVGHENLIASTVDIYFSTFFSNEVRRTDPNGSYEHVVFSGSPIISGYAQAIDIDSINNKLYFTDDLSNDAIMKSVDLDTLNYNDIISSPNIDYVRGFRVLDASGLMYWIDVSNEVSGGYGEISRANLDGSNQQLIIAESGLIPQDVDIDLVENKLYWTANKSPLISGSGITWSIRKSNLDGSNIEIISSGISRFHGGIAIDSVNRKVYWGIVSESYPDEPTMYISNLDGSDRQIFIPSGYKSPYDIDIDETRGKLYWTETILPTRGLYKVNLDGTNIEQLPVDITVCDELVCENDQVLSVSVDERYYRKLFIYGFEVINDNVDLVIFGHAEDSNNIEIFIFGNDSIVNNIDLFIEGGATAVTITNEIDLFITGNETTTDNINLFIYGKDNLNDICDFFIHGFDSFNNNIELFVFGHDTTENNKLYTGTSHSISPPGILRRSNEDGSNQVSLVSSENILQICADQYENILFWNTDSIITKSDLNGNNKQIINNGTANSLDVDIVNNKIYVSSVSGIRRFNYDGSSVESIVTGNIIALGIDYLNTTSLYFSPFASGNHIFKSNLDGSNVQSIFSLSSGNTISRLDVNVIDSTIYYYTTQSNTIRKIDTNGNDLGIVGSGFPPISTTNQLSVEPYTDKIFIANDNNGIFVSGTINNFQQINISGFALSIMILPLDAITLFLNGDESITDNIDLFIRGYILFNNSTNLFINGHELNSQDLDLFINGHEIIATNIDLFTYGIDSSFNSLDLFAHGYDTENSGCDFYTNGSQGFNNNIDLFVSGIGLITNNITLFISSMNTFSSGIDLFIYGIDSNFNNIDFVIVGSQSFNDDLSLTIFGKDNNFDDCDLFTHGKNTELNSIDLFINGSAQHSNSIDLYIRGKDNNNNKIDLFISGIPLSVLFVSNIDLFISGLDTVINDVDLFLSGTILITNNIDLFIYGIASINSSIDLFVKQNDEIIDNINLFIRGLRQPDNQACPALDPTLPIQISNDLIEIYQSRIDSLINQLGKNVLLEFNPIIQPCTNCEFDIISGKSKGIYKSGGPIPFTKGQKCPYCKGIGFLEQPVYKCIKCLIQWNPKDAENYGISIDDPASIVRLKGFLTDGDDMVRARAAITNYDIQDVIKLKVKLIKGPIIVGLRQSRYIITFWKLLDS